MKSENYKKLHEDFPSLVGYYGRGCDIACGDGWYELLYKLCGDLEVTAKKQGIDLAITYIKEKWGAMDVFLSSGTDEMYVLVDSARVASTKICEACGKPGKTRNMNGWFSTLCNEHVDDYILRDMLR